MGEDELLGSRCFGRVEVNGRMEQVRTSYLKLLREVSSLRASRGVDSEGAKEMPVHELLRLIGSGMSLRRERGRPGD
ncbi:uncharacterized protein A4U43_C08F20570 [Asparagus officinalis]|nr:uncharacterized protein A4U43_C08F20570 [Asparagus officinalis]